jgi:hypothetical protein
MPSVVGLLEQHELAARRRVDGLREEAGRIQAELAAAELEWQEWAIARRRVDTVPAPSDGATAEAEVTADAQVQSVLQDAAKPKLRFPRNAEGSSTPTSAWSSPSAGRSWGTATSARRGSCPVRRMPSAGPS